MSIGYIINEENITVMVDGKPIQVVKGNSNFFKIKKSILSGDMETAKELALASKEISRTIEASSDKVTVSDGEVKYMGHPIHLVVTKTLINMINEGLTNVQPWVNHIEKLMQNPNSKSREELYDFLSYKGLPIDDDGCVFAYKGVDSDYWSKHGNSKTIVLQGKTDGRGRIYNGVGEKIVVDRGSVDGVRENSCSHGLHVGSYNYARDWSGDGGRLLLVKFDPKDSVSVPTDCHCQKLRVCAYTVVRDVTDEFELSSSYYGSNSETTDSQDFSDEDIEKEVLEFMIEVGVDSYDYARPEELIDDLCAYDYYNPHWNNEQVERVVKNIISNPDPNAEVGDHRVRQYIKTLKGKYVTTGAVQKNLGIKGLSCDDIAVIAIQEGLTCDGDGMDLPISRQFIR